MFFFSSFQKLSFKEYTGSNIKEMSKIRKPQRIDLNLQKYFGFIVLTNEAKSLSTLTQALYVL